MHDRFYIRSKTSVLKALPKETEMISGETTLDLVLKQPRLGSKAVLNQIEACVL
jgi:hypothetical protein